MDPANLRVRVLRGYMRANRCEPARFGACGFRSGHPGASRPIADALVGRARVYLGMAKTEEAMADLDEAVRRNPGSRYALNARGRARMQAGRYAEAIADFDAIIRDNPDDPVGYNSRCDALALAGRVQEALSDCDKALSIRPDFVAALDSRGVVYLRLGQYQSAIERLRRGVAPCTTLRAFALRAWCRQDQER